MKIDILFGILLTILNKKIVTSQYLSHKYEISVRTVYRYVNILVSNNIPIVTKTGPGGGISINNTINLQNLFFTIEEKLTLLQLTQFIDNPKLKLNIQTKLLALK